MVIPDRDHQLYSEKKIYFGKKKSDFSLNIKDENDYVASLYLYENTKKKVKALETNPKT